MNEATARIRIEKVGQLRFRAHNLTATRHSRDQAQWVLLDANHPLQEDSGHNRSYVQ